jgi:hypothetical protein
VQKDSTKSLLRRPKIWGLSFWWPAARLLSRGLQSRDYVR